jgi:hypothetical protein
MAQLHILILRLDRFSFNGTPCFPDWNTLAYLSFKRQHVRYLAKVELWSNTLGRGFLLCLSGLQISQDFETILAKSIA